MALTGAEIAAITAAANAAGQGANALATGKLNRKNRRWQEKMYQRQIEDNREFWHMQNKYNSPTQQMKRFKQAGLNPHLVYGKGSASAGVAGPVQSGSVGTPSTQAPRYGDALSQGASAFMRDMYHLEKKSQELDNMEAQNTILQEQAALTAANARRAKLHADDLEFDLGLKSELRQTSVDSRKENLRQQKIRTDNMIRQDVRETLKTTKSLQEATQRIANMKIDATKNKQQIKNMRQNLKLLKKEGVLKDLEIQWSEMGVGRNDPMWVRMAARYVEDLLEMDPPSLEKAIDKEIEKFKERRNNRPTWQKLMDPLGIWSMF